MTRLRWFLVLLLAAAALLTACGSDEDDDDDDTGEDADEEEDGPPPVTEPTLGNTFHVVPSDGLPPGLPLQQANNNLDVIRHDGRVFLAFRSGPNHFASPDVVIHVVSSEDQIHWDFETTFARETDLREPRLLSFDGRLFLYFALLGESSFDFEPGGVMATEYLGPGEWSEPQPVYLPGLIAWRTKTVNGIPYMLGYIGGESIYDIEPEPIETHWLSTQNGYDWYPVVPDQPVVLLGGGSEADFVYAEDGAVIAVSRNEMGDETGFGMNVCRAEPDDIGQWNCVNDPRKYDSPLMFERNGKAYLIGRRNLTATGAYDLGLRRFSMFVQRLLNELAYWVRPKRCALWEVDPLTLEVDFVLDLPSRGDTCFPAILDEGGGNYMIYNYTSPLDGPDAFWLQGQLGPTFIVRTELALP